jgi:hypothetical protein
VRDAGIPCSRVLPSAAFTVARIPGTSEVLAGGFTYAAGNAGLDRTGVLLEYEV